LNFRLIQNIFSNIISIFFPVAICISVSAGKKASCQNGTCWISQKERKALSQGLICEGLFWRGVGLTQVISFIKRTLDFFELLLRNDMAPIKDSVDIFIAYIKNNRPVSRTRGRIRGRHRLDF
jgi:hypothetical protein